MKAGIIDFRTPAAGFDQPIEMWLACHERIMRMIALLVRLRDHLAGGGAIESAAVTASSIVRYFEEAAPRHHDDEELDLFPRLLGKLHGAERDRIARTIEALRQEHASMEGHWRELRPRLRTIERGSAAHLDDALLTDFVNTYRRHVEQENAVLGPAFQRAFDPRELEAIGKAMAERRGVNWDELRKLEEH